MTRIIEIINNTLILKKQVLEQELEEIINSNEGSVEDRVKKAINVLNKVSKTNNTKTTLTSYINNNNNK
jgi:3-methyladenine DNA glycosylase AlkD|tara:strand:- start:4384 stop:4590 length:207 start_codon:yes stop_codon:yes gene_type:complete